jgi:hypothetical protein
MKDVNEMFIDSIVLGVKISIAVVCVIGLIKLFF